MKPPTCSRCDEPCTTIYTYAGRKRWDDPQGFGVTHYAGDSKIIWLCADCVDEVAEALA